jgi:hypothetical protein
MMLPKTERDPLLLFLGWIGISSPFTVVVINTTQTQTGHLLCIHFPPSAASPASIRRAHYIHLEHQFSSPPDICQVSQCVKTFCSPHCLRSPSRRPRLGISPSTLALSSLQTKVYRWLVLLFLDYSELTMYQPIGAMPSTTLAAFSAAVA